MDVAPAGLCISYSINRRGDAERAACECGDDHFGAHNSFVVARADAIVRDARRGAGHGGGIVALCISRLVVATGLLFSRWTMLAGHVRRIEVGLVQAYQVHV